MAQTNEYRRMIGHARRRIEEVMAGRHESYMSEGERRQVKEIDQCLGALKRLRDVAEGRRPHIDAPQTENAGLGFRHAVERIATAAKDHYVRARRPEWPPHTWLIMSGTGQLQMTDRGRIAKPGLPADDVLSHDWMVEDIDMEAEPEPAEGLPEADAPSGFRRVTEPPKGLPFELALAAMKAGRTVRRPVWGEGGSSMRFADGDIVVGDPGEKWFPWRHINRRDLTADDWIVEPIKDAAG